MFRNRQDAGQKLAARLTAYKDHKTAVLALPRGGVPVAAEIAAKLNAPLDLILVRKIGVPFQPELAMGAVVDGGSPIVVRNEEVIELAGVSEDEFKAACAREQAEVERRRQCYLAGRPPIEVAGHVAIVVDDGVATGATMRAALRSITARKPGKLVLAIPVAPTEAVTALQQEVDEVVCLEPQDNFRAIGPYYDDFRQVSDDEVRRFLAPRPVEATA
jgi:putative phosphoribosyl transferase